MSFFPVKPWNLRLKPRIVSCWWSIVITEPVSSKQSTAVKVPNGRHFCSSQLNARFTLKLPSVRRGADSFARSCAWKALAGCQERAATRGLVWLGVGSLLLPRASRSSISFPLFSFIYLRFVCFFPALTTSYTYG